MLNVSRLCVVVPAINIVSSVFSLGKATLDSGKLDLGLVSAGSNGIEP